MVAKEQARVSKYSHTREGDVVELDFGELGHVRREGVDRLPVQAIGCRYLYLWQRVQDVQLRQTDRRVAVHHVRVPHHREIQPAAPARLLLLLYTQAETAPTSRGIEGLFKWYDCGMGWSSLVINTVNF